MPYFGEGRDGAAGKKEPFSDMKDEELLFASLEEPALFEALVERYQEPLMRAAWRVVKGREEAEDVVQESFVKIYKNAEKFRKLDGIEFKSWAYKVAINTAITHYRKLKRGGEILSQDPVLFFEISEDLGIASLASSMDAKAAVASTLEKMPSHLETVLRRYYFEDKSYRTIAAEEKISIPTLKMRLFRAKRLFKKLQRENGIISNMIHDRK
jgi:RNA polymerase sigma-70 factor (ECF subfamily)